MSPFKEISLLYNDWLSCRCTKNCVRDKSRRIAVKAEVTRTSWNSGYSNQTPSEYAIEVNKTKNSITLKNDKNVTQGLFLAGYIPQDQFDIYHFL